MHTLYYSATVLLSVLSGVQAGHGSVKTYPTCPTLKNTFVTCGEGAGSDPTVWPITQWACSQMSANNKCNANTNIYSSAQCINTSDLYYCEASIVQSIDINTFRNYCNAYNGQYNNLKAKMTPFGDNNYYHLCSQNNWASGAPIVSGKVKKDFVA